MRGRLVIRYTTGVTGKVVAIRERDPEATRRAILEAAAPLLAAGGEEGLSIREVCARAGVTPPTVYHHFGDKMGLVNRVIDDCFDEFVQTMSAARRPKDPVELLRWAFDRYVDYGVQHPTHYWVLFGRRNLRPTRAGITSYGQLRDAMASVAAAGRLTATVDHATAAFWAAAHGATSLVVGGFWKPGSVPLALVRDGIVGHITCAAPKKRARSRR